MRKRVWLILSMMAILLTGCGRETVSSESESEISDVNETMDAVTEVPDETEKMEIAEVEEAEVAETVEPKYITIDFNGVTETHAEEGLGYSVKVEYFIRRG